MEISFALEKMYPQNTYITKMEVILGLQPREKVIMLKVKTIKIFLEEFT